MKKIIQTDSAPAPIGPYNQAVKAGSFLFVSGQISIDPATGQMIQDNIANEARMVMQNLKAILEKADMEFSHVVKTAIFLKDMNDFAAVNEVYGSYFKDNYPARETVQVSRLPKDANVEISVVAFNG
jgi:2-iminobutanoate/2-iminopropanoate deaminase